MSREHLEIATHQICFARKYTLALVEDVDETEWFVQPAGAPTHLAWQLGHLAMAQYALTMLRLRGKEAEDEAILSKDFFRTFQKGTTPEASPAGYPSIGVIRDTLQRVHQASLGELAAYTDADLDVKLPEPHAVFDTKLGSVFFCSAHELIHAGQIGLLRRLLGKAPLR